MIFLFARFLPRWLRLVGGIALLVLGVVFHLAILEWSGVILLAVACVQIVQARRQARETP